jgi:hypothetical protein
LSIEFIYNYRGEISSGAETYVKELITMKKKCTN